MAEVNININIIVPDGSARVNVIVPANEPMYLVALSAAMVCGLPTITPNGRRCRYRLRYEEQGVIKYLPDHLSLEAAGVNLDNIFSLVRTHVPPNFDPVVGRSKEQADFRHALGVSMDGAVSPHLFLVEGEAGIGKTQLLRSLKDIAENEPPFSGRWMSLYISWYDEREKGHELGLRQSPEQISPRAVLNAIAEQMNAQLSQATPTYDRLCRQLEEAEWCVERALAQETTDGEFAVLLRWRPRDFQISHEGRSSQVGEYAEQGKKQTSGWLAARFLARCFGQTDLPLRDLFLNPWSKLVQALGADLRALQNHFVFIALDACELITTRLINQCLRDLIVAGGGAKVWAIAMERNLLIEDRHGVWFPPREDAYWESVTNDKIVLEGLTANEIKDLCNTWRVIPDNAVSDSEAEDLQRLTRGNPRNILQLASYLGQGIPLQTLLNDSSGRSERTDWERSIAQKLLAGHEPEEREIIRLLAMLRRPDAELMCDVLRRWKDGNLRLSLESLTRRYLYVQAEGSIAEPARSSLRSYLLAERATHDKDVLCRIACEVLLERLDELVTDDELSLAARWAEPTWVHASLDRLHLLLWTKRAHDPAAWLQFTCHFIEALAYGPQWIPALLDTARDFQSALPKNSKHRRLFETIEQGQGGPVEAHDRLVQELSGRQSDGWLTGTSEQEVQWAAILAWQRAGFQLRASDYGQAIRSLDRAFSDLPVSEIPHLRQCFVKDYLAAAAGLSEQITASEEIAVIEATEIDLALSAAKQALVLQGDTGKEAAPIDLQLAVLYSLLGQMDAARSYAIRATQLAPTEGDAWQVLATIHAQLGELQHAANDLARACELRTQDYEICLELGQLSYGVKDYAGAIQAFGRALERTPPSDRTAAAWTGLGNAHFMARHYREALSAYTEAAKSLPMHAKIHANLANVCYALKQPARAARYYRKAADLAPDWAYPRYQLGILHLSRGETEAAITRLREAAGLEQGSPFNLYWVGTAWFERAEFDRALDWYRKTVEVDADFALGHYGCGRALLAKGEHGAASKALAQAVKLEDGNAIAWYYLAQAELAGGDLTGALMACEQATELDARLAPAFCLMGDAYLALRRYADALRAYHRGQALSSRKWARLPWSVLHQRCGHIFYAQEEFSQAITAYTESLQLAPDDAQVYCARGWASFMQGDLSAAQADFQRAVNLRPDLWVAYNGLGAISLARHQWRSAEESYQHALECARSELEIIHLYLGVLKLRRSLLEAAEEHLFQVIDRYSRAPAAAVSTGRCAYTIAQLALRQIPTLTVAGWADEIADMRSAGLHHYLRQYGCAAAVLSNRSSSDRKRIEPYELVIPVSGTAVW